MSTPLEIHRWENEGYAPLVFSDGWQTALLNWDPIFDHANLGAIERHKATDEVFVLLRGRAAMFVTAGADLTLIEMEPGVVYNVPRGVWHNLVATRDVRWVIVENRDTHLHDSEVRPMRADEHAQLAAQMPAWAKE